LAISDSDKSGANKEDAMMISTTILQSHEATADETKSFQEMDANGKFMNYSTKPVLSKNAEDDRQLLLQAFKEDLKILQELRPPIPSANILDRKTIILAGSSYTLLWTHSTWKHHGKGPLTRSYFPMGRQYNRSSDSSHGPDGCLVGRGSFNSDANSFGRLLGGR
jgi:hypothetical protein